MASITAVYSTEALKERNAQQYKSMTGKVHPPLLKALDSMGYEYMTPVQQKVLTELPSFKADCLVQAKTGTGKTIAFLLPALHSLLTEQTVPAGQVGILIVSPTRELALQIAKEGDQLTSQMPRRIECHTAFGGTKKEQHLKTFLNGKPTVLVATPGRLNDYLSDEYVRDKFTNLRTLILDEADTMLEAGFLPDITRILNALPPKAQAGWQGMCFSATMPEKIKGVLGKVLKPGYTHLSTVDPNEVPTIDSVKQFSIVIPTVSDTFNCLHALIEQEQAQSPNDFKAIIFGTTANGVALFHDLFEQLCGNTMKIYQLQSRLSQNVRTRTTDEFKAASSGLMFASDVIGRGMDFQGVGLVIQVGLPSNGEQYVHRVGRTARAGNEGRAVIMLTDREKYFLTVNKHLPIQPYPMATSASAPHSSAPKVHQALARVSEDTKRKAYQAYLGFHKSFLKQLRLDSVGLVALANEFAAAMGCPEPPMIDRQVVGKMGLKGVRGLNIGVVDKGPSRRPPPGPVKMAGTRPPPNPTGPKSAGGAPARKRVSEQNGQLNGGVQKRGRGAGSGRKGGRTKAHQGPPGGEA
ncbi:hypothetical protein LTS18_003498 [Coniosporium uncinatum]|uniref:Uncharacterized protein n=1 Tax=Coniosporium uncinatum TaxID=93489 RepID=A0ACC3DTL3_9PEZI|nr:hypothetical protein LTS18_003498 [Coniosporium uncinatum]